MRILLLNGPNLNKLGTREPEIYGRDSLVDIVGRVEKRAIELGAELAAFQSNHEGALIDFIQTEADTADGLILNFGSLTHSSIGVRDAVVATGLPAYEVHISNIFAREEFRHRSMISDICKGIVSGFGWRGYLYALDALVAGFQEGSS
jgi:3-dehydroquinate dehydratase-2